MRTPILLTGLAALALAPAVMAKPAPKASPGASLCAATSSSGAALSRVTFYSGNVADNAVLAPDSSRVAEGIVTNTWTFGRDVITLVCSYGPEDTAIPVLLQTSTKSCVVRYRDAPGAQPPKPIDVICR